MADETGRRLGRGLAALIGEAGDDQEVLARTRGRKLVPVEFLRPNPRNPRKHFEDSDLEDLASSIRERGVIQPIIVRAVPGMADLYEIIAGERRWRASQRAGLHEVPILEVEADDREALEIAIVENVQRADLNAIEEAAGYQRLIDEFSHSQADLGRIVGKSRSHIANTLRLLKLPDSVKAHVQSGALSAGHARALLALDDPEGAALRAIEKGLTVRDLERMGQEEAAPETKSAVSRPAREKDADTQALEQALESVLGLAVTIDHKGPSGQIKIKYKNVEQLELLCQRLRG